MSGMRDPWLPVEEDWHKLWPEHYEAAVAEAAGSLAGGCQARGEDGPMWTDAFHAAFRDAVKVAFNRGFAAAWWRWTSGRGEV